MLWLRAWFETATRFYFQLGMGAIIVALPLVSMRKAPAADPHRLFLATMMLAFMGLLGAIMMAGSGIQTVPTRPGGSERGGEGATLFTLALPVTRTSLFVVRTIIGILATAGGLAVWTVVTWSLLPARAVDAHDALGALALIGSTSLVMYAISACLSTFCDDAWRIRVSGVALVVPWILTVGNNLPGTIIRRNPLGWSSPLITHQIPWTTIAACGILTALLFATALMIIQRREY
jgi:hypothetical protein